MPATTSMDSRAEPILWSATHFGAIPGCPGFAVYRRQAAKLAHASNEESGSGTVQLMEMGADHSVTFGDESLDRNAGLDFGTKVDIAVEIMDEVEHGCPFYIGPLSQPWSNAAELRKLAIRISWDYNGQRLTRYIRQSVSTWANGSNSNGVEYPKGFSEHGQLTMLMAFFRNETIFDENGQTPHYALQHPIDAARVLDIKTDLTTGQIEASARTQVGTTVQVTERAANSRAALASHGLSLNRAFGDIDWIGLDSFVDAARPPGYNVRQIAQIKKRVACDCCFVVTTLVSGGDADHGACIQQPGTEFCTKCVKNKVACTFSPTHRLLGDDMFRDQHEFLHAKPESYGPVTRKTWNTFLHMRFFDHEDGWKIVKDYSVQQQWYVASDGGLVEMTDAE